MAKRILLCLSHSIEEHDQIRLLSGLGYDVFSIGGYIDPARPHDDKRPPIYSAQRHEDLQKVVDSLGTPDNLGAAQSRIPGEILEWLGPDGVIIYHHYLDRLWGQWMHLAGWRKSGGRVVWRSVGQSDHVLENTAAYFRRDGLERVAYSPKEANIPGYCGHDALIRFYGDPEQYYGWTGFHEVVINVTQHLMQRGSSTHGDFFVQAVSGLDHIAVGAGSEAIGGVGTVPYEAMKTMLRNARAYLYTGTQPASYTLGFIEAAMTGVPIVSIGANAWGTHYPYSPGLFEAHELSYKSSDHPGSAGRYLHELLNEPALAMGASEQQRATALELFSMDRIGAQWKEFLG